MPSTAPRPLPSAEAGTLRSNGWLPGGRARSGGATAVLGADEEHALQQVATALAQRAGGRRLRQLQSALPAGPEGLG